MRLIKKYKNRRLYDTEKSKYITVEELRHYVVEGLPFRVEDSVTQQDITSATLLQILVEMEAGPTQFLSPDMLRQLICLANHPMSQSWKALLGEMFASIEKQMRAAPYLGEYQKASAEMNKQLQDMVSNWLHLFEK